MPRGLNRSGDFRNGSPITTPHEFGNPVTLPHDFGNDVTWTPDPAHFGNAVTWAPSPAHFGNTIGPALPQLSTPTFDIEDNTFLQSITITPDASATTTYYTTDGSTPDTGSTVYSTPFDISTAETVKAISVAVGFTDSAVGSQAYTLTSTPVISLSAGDGQQITLTADPDDYAIFFTTDGSSPTGGSAYTGPFDITAAETVKAIGLESGFVNSLIASTDYLQQATPTFSPVAGTYSSTQSVTITSSGATHIYYTTDGSDPTVASGTLYTGAISVTATETIKALAVRTGYVNSAIGSALYTISAPTPTFVQAASTTVPVNTSNVSFAHDTVNGNTILVFVTMAGFPAAGTCTGCSDNGTGSTNVYTLVRGPDSGAQSAVGSAHTNCYVFICQTTSVIQTGKGPTLTGVAGGGYMEITAVELFGAASGSGCTVDATSFASQSSNTAFTGAACNVATASALVLAAFNSTDGNTDSRSFTATAPFTICTSSETASAQFQDNSVLGARTMIEQNAPGITGNITAHATLSAAGVGSVTTVAVK